MPDKNYYEKYQKRIDALSIGCGGTETVNKITGETGIFKRSRASLENLYYNGKSVEIPEKYQYKGEIKYD